MEIVGSDKFTAGRGLDVSDQALLAGHRASRAVVFEAAPEPPVGLALENAMLRAALERETTQRARVEEALCRWQERYAHAVEASRDGHACWVAGTGEFHVSPRLLEICGFPPGTILSGWADFFARLPFDPDERERILDTVGRRFAAGADRVELEMQIRRVGQTRWLHLTGQCARDASGQLTAVTAVVADVTDRKIAQKEMHRMRRRLQQAQQLESIGRLAGDIAHDFNGILAIVLGCGEKARRLAEQGSLLRRTLDTVMAAGERGRGLAECILAHSRGASGERMAVPVEAVVRETLRMVAANLRPGVRIEPCLRIGQAAVLGDPTQVHQVVMNLVTNSLQAMTEGTLRVALDLERVTRRRAATTGSLAAGDYIVLTVADEGSGIPCEMIGRLFEPFFTTRKAGIGTGLGLAIVHGLVAEAGGAVDVDSKVAVGTVFTVYWPRAEHAAAEGRAAGPADGSPGG